MDSRRAFFSNSLITISFKHAEILSCCREVFTPPAHSTCLFLTAFINQEWQVSSRHLVAFISNVICQTGPKRSSCPSVILILRGGNFLHEILCRSSWSCSAITVITSLLASIKNMYRLVDSFPHVIYFYFAIEDDFLMGKMMPRNWRLENPILKKNKCY